MKHISIYSFISALALVVLASGCDSMLRTTSDRFVLSENNTLNSPNDSLYSVVGILSKMQKVGDAYVILGDLRADLMDVTTEADQTLNDISDLDITIENDKEWVDATPFYDIINHCNFLISRMDTSIFMSGKKILLPDFAAAKAVRAWAYMQLVLNYGKAFYFTEPILNIDDLDIIANLKSDSVRNRDYIFNRLIDDILPYVDTAKPSYGSIEGYEPAKLIPDIRYMLGEMYLWQNRYKEAADMYYQDIFNNSMLVNSSYVSYWQKSNFNYSLIYDYYPEYYTPYTAWKDQLLQTSSSESMTVIPYYYTESFGEFNTYKLYAMTQAEYTIAPSQRAIDFFEGMDYVDLSLHESVTYELRTKGDLRGLLGSYSIISTESEEYSENLQVYNQPEGTRYICIYPSTIDRVIIQRQTLAYLRYAEAVNRLGKPSLAMAVINSGLNRTLFTTWTGLDRNEVTLSDSLMWSYPKFDSNMGTRPRGQGYSRYMSFEDGKCKTHEDSVQYVEELLVEECGLETAFTGNRFHDLMRFSHHNPTNEIIATNIANKFVSKEGSTVDDVTTHPMYAKMLIEDNWYLPFEE